MKANSHPSLAENLARISIRFSRDQPMFTSLTDLYWQFIRKLTSFSSTFLYRLLKQERTIREINNTIKEIISRAFVFFSGFPALPNIR